MKARTLLIRGMVWTAVATATLIAVAWIASRPAEPDQFYQSNRQPTSPGELLHAESYSHDVPEGAVAWRILYSTTRHDGTPAVASAIVMVSHNSSRPAPVVAWAHGTTGLAPGCAPSVSRPFDNVPAVAELLQMGWAYVATDYVGLGTKGGHAYLVGNDAARNVLDAVRAAKKMQGVMIDNRVVVWGHSQGGNTALWTAMMSTTYAPDVNLLGVAAMAPASDLQGLLSSAQSGMFGKIVSTFLVEAYANFYPDVKAEELLFPRARVVSSDIASRCVGGLGTLFSVAETKLLPANGIFSGDPLKSALGARLAENTPQGPFAAPVFLAQGKIDDLVMESVQARYVVNRCAQGAQIEYHVVDGRDHISLVAADSPLAAVLVNWTNDRFSGKPANPGC